VDDFREVDYWSLTSDGVYYLDLAASRASISFFSFGSNTVTPVYFLQHKPTPSAGITVSKDRHWLLFSDEEDRGSNIRLVENFR
jgi:hypothetical protein